MVDVISIISYEKYDPDIKLDPRFEKSLIFTH